jgi:hypothetical protein
LRDAAALAHLFLAGALPVLACLGLGAWLLHALRWRPAGSEGLALAYVADTGVASLLLLALRAADVPIPLAACAAVALAGAPALRAPRDPAQAQPTSAAPRWRRAVDAAALALAAWTFLAALGPETFWDGFEYHLPIARAWSEGPIRLLPGWLDAETRAGVDLLYIPAQGAGEPDAAAAISAGFAAALAALVRAEASRRASPGAGSLAALLLLLAPLVVQSAPSSYVDLGAGAYGFLALCCADRWSRGADSRHLLASALFAGFAANARLHGAALAPALLALVWLGGRPPGARLLLRCAGLFALVTAPWLVKQALTTGNPLFPLFAAQLGSGPFDPEHVALRQLRLATDYPLPRDGLAGLAAYALSLTFGHNVHSGGLIGPLPLALGALALRQPSRPGAAQAGVLAALFLLQATFMPALRFALPLLPFLAVAAAQGGVRLARSGAAARWTLATVIALVAALQARDLAGAYGPRLLALREPQAYERARFPDQDALRELVAVGRGTVAIPMGAAAWMPRPVYLLHWERNGELFFEPVRGRFTPPHETRALLWRRGVRSLVIDVPPTQPRGKVGHPTLDAWLAAGVVRERDGAPRPPARRGREWRLFDFVDPAAGRR